MKEYIQGKAYVVGDNIDTDQIIPANYLVYSLSDPDEIKYYGRYALSSVPEKEAGLPKGNIPFVKAGKDSSEFSIIIAGKNFGCGSSREHAPVALQIAGVEAVIAESYARIFYRNSVDGGFFIPFETPVRLIDQIATGDELRLDISSATLLNISSGREYKLKSLGEIYGILEAGDIFAYARKSGLIKAG